MRHAIHYQKCDENSFQRNRRSSILLNIDDLRHFPLVACQAATALVRFPVFTGMK